MLHITLSGPDREHLTTNTFGVRGPSSTSIIPKHNQPEVKGVIEVSNTKNSTSVRQKNSNVSKSHAIVIGGSMAGLLAARVLGDHFSQVTLIERDRYPTEAAPRKGVPQGNHLHALMRRGQLILEDLFPGFARSTHRPGRIAC